MLDSSIIKERVQFNSLVGSGTVLILSGEEKGCQDAHMYENTTTYSCAVFANPEVNIVE